jgi:hypothetical protein
MLDIKDDKLTFAYTSAKNAPSEKPEREHETVKR